MTVPDPVNGFSVYEPGGPGGCAGGDHREDVAATARRFGCSVAMNAGFFNTTDVGIPLRA